VVSFEQLRAHVKPQDRVVMTNASNISIRSTPQQTVDYKPNGLWYGIGTSWIDWVSFEMPSWKGKNLYKLTLSTSQMLILSTSKALKEFTLKYGKALHDFDKEHKLKYLAIDWSTVSKTYGGIEIRPYQPAARHAYIWYYPWDVASGCVWNKSVIQRITKIEL